VQAGLDKGVFTKFDDGAVGLMLPVEDFGLDKDKQPRKVSFLRADGTSLYTTQDLGTAVKKATDYPLDRSIYVVACEQDLHFKQLFYALDLLGYPWARKCFHFSYEMVELPSGKMKSREGTVVDADDLVEELAGRAREIMTARGSKERGNEFMRRADLIALAALKFFLLNFGSRTKVKFDPERSVDFEGDTGPYCLYAYARASTLLEKAVEAGVLDGVQMSASTFSVIGSEKERALAHAILELQTMVKTAAENYNPTLVAKAALALAQAFNRFYKEHKVVGEEAGLAQERAWLVIAAKEMLKWGLGVLGIETLERM
jgi:arginyl-tRNA synthetase